MQLRTRPQFYRDIAQEIEYLARKAGPETARQWSEALNKTIETLRQYPQLGRVRSDLQPEGIRSWRMEHFRRWLVFYLFQSETIVLLRVRYGTMDLPFLQFDV